MLEAPVEKIQGEALSSHAPTEVPAETGVGPVIVSAESATLDSALVTASSFEPAA